MKTLKVEVGLHWAQIEHEGKIIYESEYPQQMHTILEVLHKLGYEVEEEHIDHE